jgi:hypothetical protein
VGASGHNGIDGVYRAPDGEEKKKDTDSISAKRVQMVSVMEKGF